MEPEDMPKSKPSVFEKMEAEAARMVALVQEIVAAVKPMELKSLPPVLEDFVRAAKTKDVSVVVFQLMEAYRKGAPLQALEQVLRNVGVDCWLIAREVDAERLKQMGELVTFTGAPAQYEVAVSFCAYHQLARSLFREPDSYAGNFRHLEVASVIGAQDKAAVKEFAAEKNQQDDKEFEYGTLRYSN